MMSTLKLTATAAIYVRSPTTAAAKPLFVPFSNFITSRNFHQHRRIRYTPSATKFPISNKTPSISANLGVSGKSLVSTVPPQPEPEQEQPQSSKLLTLPTILTLGRVAAVPLLVSTFYMDGWRGTVATTTIFVAASVTDWLDGYIARKMNLKSSFDAFLDPVADKLMVAATLVLLCTRPLEVPLITTTPTLEVSTIEVPEDSPILKEIFAMRDQKLKKIPREVLHYVPTTLLHSLEGMQDLDWNQLLKLQSQDGSFLFSPSSTAFAITQTGDENALDYLHKIVEKFNGGVPNVFPVDLFEHVWAVDRLERLGVSRYFKQEIKDSELSVKILD